MGILTKSAQFKDNFLWNFIRCLDKSVMAPFPKISLPGLLLIPYSLNIYFNFRCLFLRYFTSIILLYSITDLIDFNPFTNELLKWILPLCDSDTSVIENRDISQERHRWDISMTYIVLCDTNISFSHLRFTMTSFGFGFGYIHYCI